MVLLLILVYVSVIIIAVCSIHFRVWLHSPHIFSLYWRIQGFLKNCNIVW